MVSRRHTPETPDSSKAGADDTARWEGEGGAVRDATPEELIEPHRRCPRCWGGHHGYGVAQNTAGRKRYMKCVKALDADWDGCGHNWVTVITPVQVHHRDVDLETRGEA